MRFWSQFLNRFKPKKWPADERDIKICVRAETKWNRNRTKVIIYVILIYFLILGFFIILFLDHRQENEHLKFPFFTGVPLWLVSIWLWSHWSTGDLFLKKGVDLPSLDVVWILLSRLLIQVYHPQKNATEFLTNEVTKRVEFRNTLIRPDEQKPLTLSMRSMLLPSLRRSRSFGCCSRRWSRRRWWIYLSFPSDAIYCSPSSLNS